MPFLDKTKYKNNVRTIVGTPQIYPDDVILLCDTSIGPVTINLLDIPNDFWNTQWQMFIVDKSGNASVNNITINAGVGQVINGGVNLVLNINNSYANIRISGNGKYIATTSSGGGGATINGHIIQDEGVSLPQQPILDFVGNGVTATNGAGKTIVNIPGGAIIIPTTNANLKTLVSTNSIIPGAYYLVTDPGYADQGVLVTGLLTNGNTSVHGIGLYLNADYQGVGNYTGVPGFVAWKNIWKNDTLGIVVGDVVIYNNRHYVNLTGVNYDGVNPPNADLTNWQILDKSVTKGYIRATDFVYYDIESNNVITRIDNKQNEVDLFLDGKGGDSITYFQWGRNVTLGNKVKAGSIYYNANSYAFMTANSSLNGAVIEDNTDSKKPGIFEANVCVGSQGRMTMKNNYGQIRGNMISNGFFEVKELNNGIIELNTIDSFGRIAIDQELAPAGLILRNTISSSSKMDLFNTIEGEIEDNNLNNSGVIKLTGMLPLAKISKCNIATQTIEYINYNRIVSDRSVISGYSNWDEVFDFNNGLYWDGAGTFTIPPDLHFIGIAITLNSGAVGNVTKIIGPAKHRFIVRPDQTTSLRVFHTPIGVAVPRNLLCDASPSLNILTGRADGCDFVEYQASGNLYLRTNLVVVA
jgi:hypothetical protein